MNRRQFLLSAGAWVTVSDSAFASVKESRLGIAIPSYAIRSRLKRKEGFRDPIQFLSFIQQRGAGGAQLPLGIREASYAKKVRALLEKHDLFLEGSLRTPRSKADVERFESEVRTAKASGATILRTVMLGGRRYETFSKLDELLAFRRRSMQSLQWAVPILTRHRMKLAIENHKDFRTDELIQILRSIKSDVVGVCVDTGNNIALLEDALTMTKMLAPWAISCHLKDMAVEESRDGFLLSEVPLGTGLLDLSKISEVLKKANPQIRFSLEMITRDPLRIPCLSEKYWATFPKVSGRELARTLTWVRKNQPKTPLKRISKLSTEKQLELEEANVLSSLRYVNENLKL